MLADGVHLNLVARLQLDGKANVANYFGRYLTAQAVMHVTPTNIEGRPALWLHQQGDPTGQCGLHRCVRLAGRKLERIQDFRYAFYFEDRFFLRVERG